MPKTKLKRADTKAVLKNDTINLKPMRMLIDNKTFSLPCSSNLYEHIPLLPSQCNKIIKYLETLRDNFTDEEIICFNEQMNKEYINSLKGNNCK